MIDPATAQKMFHLERYLPEADPAPFVDHFWLVDSITDRVLPLTLLLGCDEAQAERQVLDAPGDAGMAAAAYRRSCSEA